ncbi:hypothetical protein [Bergeyella zoohelcum]|uniref:Outer membrane protein assembly factor BamB n=1 Tax=Bergeyella zoohelcum ATCC 43767 TaxID=883096 RepID=K1LJ36_9FLAO|nr:hypothetical protein [Bergeyella zoohelcum]EKB56730.1 hypothetical protein HMPREF9699_01459 [Bergeyella zoohelcum ATCC 43767]SUV48362.1 Uncharacterised protein [Bergeyella zoohelcum]
MKVIKKIKSVDKIFLLDNLFFYLCNKNQFCTYDEGEVQLCNINDFYIYNTKHFILKEDESSLFAYNMEDRKFEKILELDEEVIFFEPINKETVIACINRENKEYIAKYEKGYKRWEIAGQPCYYNLLHDKIIFLRDDYDTKKITKLNVQTGKSLWSYTCPEGRKIEGNLYAYQEVLAFIEIDDNVQTTLVGLDIHSGEILYKEVVGLIHYQQQGNKLYGFASTTFGDNTYSEIDILKGEVYEKSFPNYKRNTVSHLATIKEDYLYYSIYKDGGIGIIDTKKKEIIKEEFLDIEDGIQIEAPVVTEDKIYILDSEQVLHIYQRET